MESKALDRAVGKIKLILAQKEMGEKDLATDVHPYPFYNLSKSLELSIFCA